MWTSADQIQPETRNALAVDQTPGVDLDSRCPDSPPDAALPQGRRPRSFHPRRRGLSSARAVAYSSAVQRWGIDATGDELDLVAVFGRRGRFVLDIGFGAGEALVELACCRPDELVVGVDVHTPGLAAVLDETECRGLSNVRVVEGDALDLLDRLAPGALDEIRVWFPDPWPKRRHYVRRLVRPDVLVELVIRLRVGGSLHLATDVPDYAVVMERVCAADVRLGGGRVDRPVWRPITRYEQRALDAGRRPVDLVYERRR